MALYLPDANVLIHALRKESKEHESCRRWLTDINDVWLATLAIEHRATLVSTDQGFSRFPGLSWINPCLSA